EYSFDNRDNAAFPTLGMTTTLKLGYRSSTNDNGKSFGFVTPSLGIAHKLVPNGRLVLATKWKAHFNLGDDYEFYQAASIGGTDGLRGYRNQRFAGKTSYYQNTDLRYSFRKMRTGLVPTAVGLFGGFDYGRVWLPNEDSDEWHTSFGGGFFLNATDVFSMNLSAFNSDDGMRFVFGLGFGF
ncbi:MAG: ShlB/FhaC/HecB family hemolysin secretion/activation protein, partial [Flavobacteriaceae bacterium]